MWWKNILMKNIFKELEIKKKVGEEFDNSTICWISDNVYMVGDFKVNISLPYHSKIQRLCTNWL